MTDKTDREIMQQALDALIENARLLGITQAKRGYGFYSQEDAIFERALHECIAKHSAVLRERLAQPEALRLAEIIGGNCAAELRRLQAENERLHQINQSHEMKLSVRGYEIQIKDLKAVNAELLDALKDMHGGWKYIRETHGDLYGVGWDRAQKKAEAAIAKAEGRS